MRNKKTPQVIENKKSVFWDCDDTLVMWDDQFTQPGGKKEPFIDCYDGATLYLKPHKKHIQKLKGYANSGWHVVVWSAGGWKWAKTVVYTLQLEGYVDIIMGKPEICFDDLPVGEGVGRREYYQDKK